MLSTLLAGIVHPDYQAFKLALEMIEDLTWKNTVKRIRTYDNNQKLAAKRKQPATRANPEPVDSDNGELKRKLDDIVAHFAPASGDPGKKIVCSG
jgi:hypothetical protein